jgi:hypothetical protein
MIKGYKIIHPNVSKPEFLTGTQPRKVLDKLRKHGNRVIKVEYERNKNHRSKTLSAKR